MASQVAEEALGALDSISVEDWGLAVETIILKVEEELVWD